MIISELKQGLLDTIASIDKDKLSLYDLKVYSEILKTVSETHENGYEEFLKKAMDTLSTPPSTFKYPTIAEMKGEN